MPGDVTHSAPPSNSHTTTSGHLTRQGTGASSIRQGNDLTFPSEIPYNSVPRATRTSENILDLLIPRDRCNFIEFCTPRTWRWRVRFGGIFKIPNVNLQRLRTANGNSQRKERTSPDTPPDARRFAWIGLKSRPRTGPV